MDSSHVSLVALKLRSDGFEQFRCDRATSMGMKLKNLSTVLKCAGGEDSVTLRAAEDGDVLSFTFEAPGGERVSEFELKLMDIDSEHLGIPTNEYDASVRMPSGEFQRIVRDLASLGDTVEISVTKDGVRFATSGDVGSASVLIREKGSVDKPEETTELHVREPVSLSFALRYLNSFARAAPLSSHAVIRLSKDLPVIVEYHIPEAGQLSFYLAPKIADDEGMDD